jgi:hypothetical protein
MPEAPARLDRGNEASVTTSSGGEWTSAYDLSRLGKSLRTHVTFVTHTSRNLLGVHMHAYEILALRIHSIGIISF